MNLRWTILLASALLAGAAEAAPGDKKDVVRGLAGRVGPMVGSALACRDIARPRIQVIVDKFAAVVMAGVYRAAAKFIEKTHDFFPGMIYTNVSGVGGTALAVELMLPGPRYATGAVVTQVVPAVSGYSNAVLEYKNALAEYFPGEAPDDVSLEGFVSANILIQAFKPAGPQLGTEKLIDVLENMRNLDPGLGVPLSFGRAEHQASHKIWGTAIDENGKYQAIELE